MNKVRVRLKENSYDILVEPGLLNQVGEKLLEVLNSRRTVIITNHAINRIYGEVVRNSLTRAGFKVDLLAIPAGEREKNWQRAHKLYDQLLKLRVDRSTAILALGGGVIGDLAGFVAATWMRGLPFIQIPTSLVAQCDSSIGGKVAINHPQGKNLIGAFYQPKLVLVDPMTLKTLPKAELKSGLAEVIKHGIIADARFFSYLERNLERFHQLDLEVMTKVVTTNCRIKARVVSQDEKEAGLRAILNYGHTFGHALEASFDYRIRHGEGVAVGMAAAAYMAVRRGMISEAEQKRINSLIDQAGLPLMAFADVKQIKKHLLYDKKISNNQLCFILTVKIGAATIDRDIPWGFVDEILSEFFWKK